MNNYPIRWSWIIIISFFILGAFDIRFGILGIVCMGTPILHALRGEGKVHCIKYCPRGSFLGKFLAKLSLGYPLPKLMGTRRFKNGLLILMGTVFTFAIIHSGGNFTKLSTAFYRFMGVSFIVGIIMGILFKPRSWCVVCPMGHATQVIKEIQVAKPQVTTASNRFTTGNN